MVSELKVNRRKNSKYREGSEGISKKKRKKKKSVLKEKNEDFLIIILRTHFVPYFESLCKATSGCL